MLSCIMAARALHDGCTSIQHIYSPITMLTKLIGCYYNFIIKRLVLKDEGKVEVFFFHFILVHYIQAFYDLLLMQTGG